MADLVYRKIMRDLKERIFNQEFNDKKLPDERSLSESYGVSRSSIKRALNVMAQQGIIFKKRGSGTFINPLYLKNQSLFNYEGTNLGVTDSFHLDGKRPGIKLIDYQVIPASKELQQDLFLEPDDFVYKIKRLRLLDDEPIIIETGYIPIKIMPGLTPSVVKGSIFNYLSEIEGKSVTKSFMSILAEPSNQQDQELLGLSDKEPVGIMEGIFFLDDGTPLEVSNMRVHYKYLKYNTFVSLDEE
ncbi:GntR family transcriptional regulator [Paucilactobacillus oligofermentans DSM 15707 = LMG 22743]|uniref:GntR family transcriptional regulator n=1 Tax=Paucilactobacillus oligofermentans DSM 15707 = LMG 22743 TaxID=1423778 RepID=A0A0R1RPT1_9LACO|nr:GntR family transcriptional regulator [Paucilactobacillus oligofermentans]KRL55411.1 GntR family transcriptional regulator [Paucilactobacillus oligofermentans DSM 15707 = LMG 22743]CUS25599.1 HTH-type transcriptional regulator GmuR [Paucilactobacillus oligofermentans DSM 15707 = LMG 22743]